MYSSYSESGSVELSLVFLCFFFLANARLFVIGLFFCILFGCCQYQCNQLPGKTRAG